MIKHKIKHAASRFRITKQKHLYIGLSVFLLIYIPLITLYFAPKDAPKKETLGLFSLPIFSNNNITPTTTPTVTESISVVDSVSKMIDLPVDEEPVIATVTDPAQLADQEFFQKAQVDDKVIIYKNAKLAVLYRPSINKIITSAEVDFQMDEVPASPSASASTELIPSAKTLINGIDKIN